MAYPRVQTQSMEEALQWAHHCAQHGRVQEMRFYLQQFGELASKLQGNSSYASETFDDFASQMLRQRLRQPWRYRKQLQIAADMGLQHRESVTVFAAAAAITSFTRSLSDKLERGVYLLVVAAGSRNNRKDARSKS